MHRYQPQPQCCPLDFQHFSPKVIDFHYKTQHGSFYFTERTCMANGFKLNLLLMKERTFEELVIWTLARASYFLVSSSICSFQFIGARDAALLAQSVGTLDEHVPFWATKTLLFASLRSNLEERHTNAKRKKRREVNRSLCHSDDLCQMTNKSQTV